MNDTCIGKFDFLREPSEDKRNARKLYLAAFLAVAVGGLLMAIYAYQYYNQPIGLNVEYQYGIQTVGIGSPSITGTDEIVPISEGGHWGSFDTEQGSIDVLDSSVYPIPGQYELPLCTKDWPVDTWHLDLVVVGGYEPIDGFILVKQKGEVVGKMFITWTKGLSAYCGATVWKASFHICETFLLDSNQYPAVGEGFWMFDCAPGDTIPGKDVDFCGMTFWRGCHDKNQYFTIISVQQALRFSLSPFPQPQ